MFEVSKSSGFWTSAETFILCRSARPCRLSSTKYHGKLSGGWIYTRC